MDDLVARVGLEPTTASHWGIAPFHGAPQKPAHQLQANGERRVFIVDRI